MPQKMRIFLVRHGESEANLDKGLNATLPDHKIQLSEDGRSQALQAGRILRRYLGEQVLPQEFARRGLVYRGGEQVTDRAGAPLADGPGGLLRIRLWQSPYDRTRQTADGLWQGLWDLSRIPGLVLDRREDDLIREQEFGLFDGIPDDDLPHELPREYAQYAKYEAKGGRYFARMPMGESRCDVSQRVRGFFGTVQRDREVSETRQHGIENIVVVSHGVTIRCFVKEWCHLPYEWIEEEPNPGNCSIRLIEDGVDKGYVHPGWKAHRGHEAQEAREEGVVDTSLAAGLDPAPVPGHGR